MARPRQRRSPARARWQRSRSVLDPPSTAVFLYFPFPLASWKCRRCPLANSSALTLTRHYYRCRCQSLSRSLQCHSLICPASRRWAEPMIVNIHSRASSLTCGDASASSSVTYHGHGYLSVPPSPDGTRIVHVCAKQIMY